MLVFTRLCNALNAGIQECLIAILTTMLFGYIVCNSQAACVTVVETFSLLLLLLEYHRLT